MKIAIISTPFLATPPQLYGGTELMVHELAEGLVERGHDVTVFATGDSRTSGELRWLYHRAQWPPDPSVDANHVSWALAHAVAGGFDVVHAHSALALALTRLVPRGMPLVYTLHHPREESLSDFYRHFPQAWYVAISADQMKREIPLSRVTVIHHGLDPSRYTWTSEASSYVAFLGRLAPEKGPHTAIDAAAAAGVRIVVAGEVHPHDRAFGDAEVVPRLGLPHVDYLGNVGIDRKVPLLRDARALLAPIDWNEPFGLALIEAMLCGCPVVAFPRGSVPELVEPGVTGFVVDDFDELVETIRPGSALDRFDRARCRRVAAERFGRERMVIEHEALYARAAAAPRETREGRPGRGPAPALAGAA
jgi:glycosyltransferase involved in cell wall biosynthesis